MIFLTVVVFASLLIGVGIGGLVTSDKRPWEVKCKYCKRLGHYYTRCHTLTYRQKDALETLASEPPII